MPSLGVDPSASGIFGRFFGRWTEEFYLLFRLFFSVIIFMHGLQKSFLLWGFPQDHDLGIWVDIAGWVELVGAPMMALGVLTRLAGGALAVQLFVAYFTVHAGRGLWPHAYTAEGFTTLHHGGELVVIYFACAGLIGVLGSGKWGLERLYRKRELL